jgi:hypothetical protein
MSNLLVLLVLLMTTFFSSLFSPARGDELLLFSFLAWYGFRGNSGELSRGQSPVPPGSVLDLPPP